MYVAVLCRTDIDLCMLVQFIVLSTTEHSNTPREDQLFDKRMSGLYSIIGITLNVSFQEHTWE